MGLLNVFLLLFLSRFIVNMFVSHMSSYIRGNKTLARRNHVHENPNCPRDLFHVDHVEGLWC